MSQPAFRRLFGEALGTTLLLAVVFGSGVLASAALGPVTSPAKP